MVISGPRHQTLRWDLRYVGFSDRGKDHLLRQEGGLLGH